MLLQHHPGFSCPLCRTFANLEEDVEVDNDGDIDVEGDVDTSDDNVEGGGSGEGDLNSRAASEIAPLRSTVPMDLDSAMPAGALAAGAETEVERDFMPSYRRVSAGTTLRNNPSSISNVSSNLPPRRLSPPQFNGVQEDDEDYGAVMAETEAEADYNAHLALEEEEERANLNGEDDHPLPPLPVPNSGMYSTRGPGELVMPSGNRVQQQGYSIMRPMSVPVHALQGSSMGMGLSPPNDVAERPMVVEDYSDNEGGEGFEMVGEGSGSSGEGVIGAGGKRKR